MIGVSINEVLAGVAKWSRSALLVPGFNANNCIHATRTLQDVLMHFGYYGRPLTVWASIHNPALWSAVKAHAEGRGESPPHHDDPEYDRRKFWGLSVRQGNPGPGWDGHLALFVEHDDLSSPVIIDGSFDQFSRPAKKIVIPQNTVVIGVPDDFADQEQQVSFELPTGVGIIYHSKPRDHTYVRAPDWMQYAERPLYLKVRDRIIQAIEAEVRQ